MTINFSFYKKSQCRNSVKWPYLWAKYLVQNKFSHTMFIWTENVGVSASQLTFILICRLGSCSYLGCGKVESAYNRSAWCHHHWAVLGRRCPRSAKLEHVICWRYCAFLRHRCCLWCLCVSTEVKSTTSCTSTFCFCIRRLRVRPKTETTNCAVAAYSFCFWRFRASAKAESTSRTAALRFCIRRFRASTKAEAISHAAALRFCIRRFRAATKTEAT